MMIILLLWLPLGLSLLKRIYITNYQNILDGKIFEDIYMSHHLINKCKKIVFTNEVMYYYYRGRESILGK